MYKFILFIINIDVNLFREMKKKTSTKIQRLISNEKIFTLPPFK
jgi:hypothetical protein